MKIQWPFRRDAGPAPDTEAKGLTFTPAMLAGEFGMAGLRAPGSDVNYATEVRNGMYSSVITSALAWMMRTFPEAPCVVQQAKESRWENVADHPMTKLLRKPNPRYGGRVLWMATIMDFCYGEAYWLKIRNGAGAVVEVWWVPRTLITPVPDLTDPGTLAYYAYTPGNSARIELALDDVVHFRFGIDPVNIFRGFSPLAAVMREVYIDDNAANFTAAILKNLGIIGVIFSPKGGTIPKDQAEALKSYVQTNFTGDKRAQAMMFTGEMNAQLLQYNLQGFDVGPIRDIVEERVSAALAIPAAVIGFGTGLQQTKVGATMREMVKLAWQGGIEPNQAIMADELDRSLLPEFHSYKLDNLRAWFDTSQVEALTESPAEKTDRVLKLVETNVIKVSQAQRELGYPVDSAVDKYLRELMPAASTKPTEPMPRNRLPADANAPANNAPTPGDANAPAVADDSQAGKSGAEPVDTKHSIHVDAPTINLAPQPLHITIEAPRAGTKRVGTMEKIDGKTVMTVTETTDDTPSRNGDGSHDG